MCQPVIVSPDVFRLLNLSRDLITHFVLMPGNDIDRDLDLSWKDAAAFHAPDRRTRKPGALPHSAESQKSEWNARWRYAYARLDPRFRRVAAAY